MANGQVFRSEGEPVKKGADFWDVYAQRNQVFANNGAGLSPTDLRWNPRSAAHRASGVAWPSAMWTATAPLTYWRLVWEEIESLSQRRSKQRALGPCRSRRAGARRKSRLSALKSRWRRADAADSVGSIRRVVIFVAATLDPAHFGLGTVDHVDAIRVDWPEGGVDLSRRAGGSARAIAQGRREK